MSIAQSAALGAKDEYKKFAKASDQFSESFGIE